MKKVAIMQPTYLPWIGYFALMDQVDTFVFLDSVQFARRSWQQRNRIKSANGEQMLTVPVIKKDRREQRIVEVEIDTASKFVSQHIRAIQSAYGKSPFFKEYSPAIFSILQENKGQLSELTIDLILKIKEILGIRTECLRSSAMKTKGAKDELLADICEQLQADVYISPVGSKVYLDGSKEFLKRNIELRYNNFSHPDYQQLHGPFVPYMAAVDLIFNEGPKSRDIILRGIQLFKEDKKAAIF